jgi:hypothetical protein
MYEFRHLIVSPNHERLTIFSARWSGAGGESLYVGRPADWKLTGMTCTEIDQPTVARAPDGPTLVTTDGGRIVFQHGYDTTGGGLRREGIWTAPVTGPAACGSAEQITPDGAEYLIHEVGTLSWDETKVVTRCTQPSKPDAICEQSLGKAHAVKVLVKADGVDAGHAVEIGHPAYDVDGSVLFSANWRPGVPNAYQVWRWRAPSTVERVTPETSSNRDPCVFANGDIVTKTVDNGDVKLRVIKKTGGEYLLPILEGTESIAPGNLRCAG